MPSPRATSEQRERTIEFYRQLRERQELERQRSREALKNFLFVMACLFALVLLLTRNPALAAEVTGVVAFLAVGIYSVGLYD